MNAATTAAEEIALAPVSFSIPASGEGAAVYLNQTETAAKAGTGGCTGTATAPTAPAGKLCIYTEEEEVEKPSGLAKPVFNEELGVFGKPGSFLEFPIQKAGKAFARGSWAVTG